jgi:hypothetical protein
MFQVYYVQKLFAEQGVHDQVVNCMHSMQFHASFTSIENFFLCNQKAASVSLFTGSV